MFVGTGTRIKFSRILKLHRFAVLIPKYRDSNSFGNANKVFYIQNCLRRQVFNAFIIRPRDIIDTCACCYIYVWSGCAIYALT